MPRPKGSKNKKEEVVEVVEEAVKPLATGPLNCAGCGQKIHLASSKHDDWFFCGTVCYNKIVR